MTLPDLFYRDIPSVASILAVWEVIKAALVRIRTAFPIRQALGRLADENLPCLIFVKHLHTPNHDNQYRFKLPDYFPPETTNREEAAVNIPSVIAKSDTVAIGDLLNAMGQAGRHTGIDVVDPVHYWEKWDGTIVCVGGSFKSDQIWTKCDPLPVILDGGDFKIQVTGERLRALKPHDFGLLCKTRNPDTGSDVWLVIGLGVYGTEASGYFLRTKLSALGKMFGGAPFAVVVRTTLTAGGRQAMLYWYGPEVPLWRRILFWRTYGRFRVRSERPSRATGLHLPPGGDSSAVASPK